MSNALPPAPVAKEVLCYFLRNPRAADSLEGIARWRLLSENVRRTVEETREALRWLVDNGLLTATAIPGAETIYSLSEDNLAAAETFLKNLKKEIPDKHGGSQCP